VIQLPLNRLLIASHNAGKVREIGELLAPLAIEVISAAALNLPEPEENGGSFIANAQIKSRAAAIESGLPALADDSGLVIPALDGAPGIYSARWAGPNKDFGMAMERIESELHACGVTPTGTAAYFVCVLSLSAPDGSDVYFEGRVNGHLCFPASGEKGFGYDPIFIPEGETRSFAEMEAMEKHRISHRADAFRQMLSWLQQRKEAS